MNITLDYKSSHGSYVVDAETGEQYIDMLSHYSSLPLGYNHPVFSGEDFNKEVIFAAKIKTSIGKYNSKEYEDFLDVFIPFAFIESPQTDKFHFACTGSLAIEAAIKTAWWHFNKRKQRQKKTILCLQNDFHGVNGFGNFLSNNSEDNDLRFFTDLDHDYFQHIDLAGIIASIYDDPTIAAVLIEPIQCTYGDIYPDPGQLKFVVQECKKRKIPVIFDEIQAGFGVTGKTWYHQHIDILPDIVVFGKKAQVSGIIVRSEFADIFKEESGRAALSVTFDGDIIDMIRCKYIIREIKKSNLLFNISDLGSFFRSELQKNSKLINVRGIGGLIAFDLKTSEKRDEFYIKCFENGLICNPTAEKTIRLRPNMTISDHELKETIAIIRKSIL